MKHIRNLIITTITLLFVVLISYLSGFDGNYIFSIPSLVLIVCVIILIQWIMFVPSYLKSTEHYFDITGSITFITVSILAFVLNDHKNIRSIILTLLIVVWATRLGIFLLRRVKAAGSDGRFDDLKDFSRNSCIAEFLMRYPTHRYIVKRVQTNMWAPYSEIQSNLIGSNCIPIDMQMMRGNCRCKF